jgi:hypothetical protein
MTKVSILFDVLTGGLMSSKKPLMQDGKRISTIPLTGSINDTDHD